MSGFERFKKGLVTTVATAGVVGAIGAWTAFGFHQMAVSDKPDVVKKRKYKRTMTLGVVVDSSFDATSEARFYLALGRAIDVYNDNLDLDFDIEYRKVTVPDAILKPRQLFSLVPKDFKSKDYTFIVIHDSVVGPVHNGEKMTNYMKRDGWCICGRNLMFIHRFYKLENKPWLPNLIVHEMAHCLGYKKHHKNIGCLMYKDLYDGQKLCKDTIKLLKEKNKL